MSPSFDYSDVQRLVASFGNLEGELKKNVKTAGTVTARHVKDDWKSLALADLGGGSARAYPFSIGYETVELAKSIRWEIGPDKARTQGALGNLIEYGSRNNSPFGQGASALEANTADFERGIEIAGHQALASVLA
ncbi:MULTISPECIES: hypothetical protein [unclassified Pseudoclavibacter]|uniref:hypothetical protein n=1 Tax=unclassified Pseudoclavibacter TaxID=2615177 RepID=UPI000CE7E882|nr:MULTISPECIES: hypothetical protein [unclassified Pseudoclavibacter]MBF4549238.1 hypothetical protein [Pseudoclavibacter sp. VKM Ac-2888]PPF38342.1 hypothetical protein C5E05_04840 [Pseudoclavibacter sp. AY1H1]